MDELIGTNEAADILGIAVESVRRNIKRGVLESIKIGRFHVLKKSDVIAYRDRPQKTGRPKKKRADLKEPDTPNKD